MGKMEEIEARLAAKMAEIDRKLGITADAARSSRAADSGTARRQSGGRPIKSRIRSVLPDQLQGDVNDPAFWETTPAELDQLMGYVKSSPHVAGNALYAAIGPNLAFKASSDPSINAYATVEGQTPTIYMLAGAIRYANLVSAAYVASALVDNAAGGETLPEMVEDLALFVEQNNFQISSAAACDFAADRGLNLVMADPTLSRKATSFAAGLIVGILAHEYGHLALGHLYGESATLEISRNQEREADSFASSVISSSPFGDYMVMGSILWELAWVWQEKHDPNGMVATTHPLSSERLTDLINANPSAAEQLGLSFADGSVALSKADMVAVSRKASGAVPGNVKYDWTSGVICAWGCLGECNGN